MTRLRLLALPALLAATTGCEELLPYLDEVEPYLPSVRFESLEVQDVDFEHIAVDFVFAVDNPNPVEIDLASFSYNLALQDVDIINGSEDDGFTLESSGSSELVLPMDMTWQSAFDLVDATRGEDYIDFVLDGHFGFDTPVGEVDLAYEDGGNFPALRTPEITLGQLRVGDIDWINASLPIELDVTVDNEHASTLTFENFDYAITLQGVDAATGFIGTLGDVDGDSTDDFAIPLELDLLSIGWSLGEAIVAGDPIEVGLVADTDVVTPFGTAPLSLDELADMVAR